MCSFTSRTLAKNYTGLTQKTSSGGSCARRGWSLCWQVGRFHRSCSNSPGSVRSSCVLFRPEPWIITGDASCEGHLKSERTRSSFDGADRGRCCGLVFGVRRQQRLVTFLAVVECLIDLPACQRSFGIDLVWSVNQGRDQQIPAHKSERSGVTRLHGRSI